MRRLQFKSVSLFTIFYSEFRWYQKISVCLAYRADAEGQETVQFKKKTWVRIFDESAPPRTVPRGLSFEQFIEQAAL